MLEGIQILIDRMEIFPDDFREGGKLHDFLFILDEDYAHSGATDYYEKILTKEEIAAYREATLKFRRENLNRAVLEAVMQGQPTQRENKLLKEMRSFTQKSGLYGEVAVGGAGGGGTGVIGGGAFATKIGALFTPANTTQKKKK
jgi:hypothetical protein